MKTPLQGTEWDLLSALQQLRDTDPTTAMSDELSFKRLIAEHAFGSKAQLFQDLWVLWELGGKRQGYFVEFGAFDGVTLSNTWMLEQAFDWTGILAEPNPDCHSGIRQSRRATLDERCVYDTTGKILEFSITTQSEFSTIANFADQDAHGAIRSDSRSVRVPTVSLSDLLDEHGAPDTIDYLSADTEGSELQILRSFDWKRHVRCITVEHNYTANQALLDEHLTARGYVRKFAGASRWDGWYVHRDDCRTLAGKAP